MAATIQSKIQISPDLQSLIDNHALASEGIKLGMEYITLKAPEKVKARITQLGLTGNSKAPLVKSIIGQVSKDKGIIGSTKPTAHILEGGAKPHKITVESKKAISFPGAEHPVRVIHHPGVRAYKFLEGTIDEMEQSGELESLFARGVREALEGR